MENTFYISYLVDTIQEDSACKAWTETRGQGFKWSVKKLIKYLDNKPLNPWHLELLYPFLQLNWEELKNTTGIGGAFILRAVQELANVDLVEHDIDTTKVTLKQRLYSKTALDDK